MRKLFNEAQIEVITLKNDVIATSEGNDYRDTTKSAGVDDLQYIDPFA